MQCGTWESNPAHRACKTRITPRWSVPRIVLSAGLEPAAAGLEIRHPFQWELESGTRGRSRTCIHSFGRRRPVRWSTQARSSLGGIRTPNASFVNWSELRFTTRPYCGGAREGNRTPESGMACRCSATERLTRYIGQCPSQDSNLVLRFFGPARNPIRYRGQSACDGIRTRKHPMDSRAASRWRSQASACCRGDEAVRRERLELSSRAYLARVLPLDERQ